MNKEMKDVFFKLSTKIDESNHRIEEIAEAFTYNYAQLDEKIDRKSEVWRLSNSQIGTRLDKKADKTQVDDLVIEIEKLIGLFQAFERVIHKGVKH